MLKENPEIMSLDQTLCRLLFLHKRKAMPEDDYRVIAALETHLETRRDLSGAESDDEPGVDPTLAVATNARLATKSPIDLAVIRRLYCAVSATQVSKHSQKQSHSF